MHNFYKQIALSYLNIIMVVVAHRGLYGHRCLYREHLMTLVLVLLTVRRCVGLCDERSWPLRGTVVES